MCNMCIQNLFVNTKRKWPPETNLWGTCAVTGHVLELPADCLVVAQKLRYMFFNWPLNVHFRGIKSCSTHIFAHMICKFQLCTSPPCTSW